MFSINERFIIFRLDHGKKQYLKVCKFLNGSKCFSFTESIKDAELYQSDLLAEFIASAFKGAGVQRISSAIQEMGGVLN